MSKRNKGNKKKKNSLKKLFLCIIFVAIIIVSYYVYINYFKKSNTVTAPKVVDEIKSFNYVVNENDSKLFKSTFNDLKTVLSAKEVDNKKYAEVISKLFIIDFFTLSNKTSKNDVGGVQFVYSTYKTDFVDYARDGIYKQVSNVIDSSDNKNLPTVDSVNVSSIEEIDPSAIFDFSGSNAYEVTLDWTYKNSDDFQTSSTLTIVKDNDKLSIAKMTKN